MANAGTTDSVELLTTAQVAKVMQVHPETVRRLIKSGELRAVQLKALGNYRIPRSELDRLIQEGARA